MNLSMQLKPALLTVALLSALNGAYADISLYTDPAAFNAVVTSAGTDTFFGMPLDQAALNPLNRRTLIGERYDYQVSASTGSLIGAGTDDDSWLTANVASDVITFSNFGTGITAFGGKFFGTDFNGLYQAGNVTLKVTDALGGIYTQTLNNPTVNSFLGFVSTGAQIVSVSLFAERQPSGDSLWPTAREVVLAQAVSTVPEPAAAGLMLFGLAGLALARRRQH